LAGRPGPGPEIGELIKQQQKIIEIKKLIERIYGASGKEEELSKLSDEENAAARAQPQGGRGRSRRRYSTRGRGRDQRQLEMAGLPVFFPGKVALYDAAGRVRRPVTVGYMHMLKLHHLVDDKMHARSTGPYSLVTQQPLGGKAQFGGQRFRPKWRCGRSKPTARPTRCRRCSRSSPTTSPAAQGVREHRQGRHKIDAGMPESFNVRSRKSAPLASTSIWRGTDESAFLSSSSRSSRTRKFDAIKIGLASPEKIRSWSYGEVKKPETINYPDLSSRARRPVLRQESSGRSRTTKCLCGKYKAPEAPRRDLRKVRG